MKTQSTSSLNPEHRDETGDLFVYFDSIGDILADPNSKFLEENPAANSAGGAG
jgi:hypothetical protein